jgi:chromosome partitioning protein
MKTLAVVNQKGGVGKSTTAAAIGDALRDSGAAVLFVDLDAQGNLTHTLGAAPNGGSLAAMKGTAEVQHTDRGDVLASAPALAAADITITETGKEYRLREALQKLSYDYCVIDTPPTLGILTVNALTAADGAIIPAQADIYSLQGIAQLASTTDAVRKYCNPGLKLLGILITRYNGRAVIRREAADALKQTAKKLGTQLFDTRIRDCTAIVEAQARRESIFTYAPKSNAARDYRAFTDELKGVI